ncbi:hypothetical protein Pcinc_036763 [Petrolisthes cinctipes]|uniref:Fibronectin type-III domain-containing protein n=1 Tax=Petrolisthes cinctipes TaxID=88211 RepID=A0AAE1BXB5_PETCI|nr:hypothetical protein Pcinc_036763 [Petrolisthes cinctipes]
MSGSTTEEDVNYILLNIEVPDGDLEVYQMLSSVIMNYDTTTDIKLSNGDGGILTINDATKKNPDVTSATLDYNPTKTVLESTDHHLSTNTYEIVNYWSDDSDSNYQLTLCLSLTTLKECEFEYTPSTRSINVLLVGYDSESSEKMLDSNIIIIKDPNVEVAMLTTTSELTWHEFQSGSTYRVVLNEEGESEISQDELPFTSADITCYEFQIKCYSYFLGLDTNKVYEAKLQQLDDNSSPIILNTVISNTFPGSLNGVGVAVTAESLVHHQSLNLFRLCYTEALSNVLKVEVTLMRLEGISSIQKNVKGTISENCVEVAENLQDWNGQVTFHIRFYDDTDQEIFWNSVGFIQPDLDAIPSCNAADKVGDGKMLRLSCTAFNPTENILTIGSTTINNNIMSGSTTEEDVNYILLNIEVPDGDLEVYQMLSSVIMNYDTTTDIKLSNGDGGILTINDATKKNPDVTSATLDYNPTKTVLESTDHHLSTNTYEIVNYWSDDSDSNYQLTLCLSLTTLKECEFEYTPSTRSINVLLVGYDSESSEKMLDSNIIIIKDPNVEVAMLTTTSELTWHEFQSGSTYRVVLNEEGESEISQDELPFTSADITCYEFQIKCYSYFLGLDTNKVYEAKLQQLDDNSSPIILNTVISNTFPGSLNGVGVAVTAESLVHHQSLNLFRLCYTEALSNVLKVEVTLMRLEGISSIQKNVKGTISENCVEVAENLQDWNGQVTFHIRFYDDNDQEIFWNSVGFIQPDLDAIPSCNAADKVGDGKMLRLSCTAFNPTENILTIGSTTINNNIMSGSTTEEDVNYILLNIEVPDGDLEVYQMLSSVIMNYDTTTDIKLSNGDGGILTINDATKKNPDVTSATLDYNPTKTVLESTDHDLSTNTYEIVNYWSDDSDSNYQLTLCLSLTTPKECEFEYTPSTRSINVLLVGYNSESSEKMLDSNIIIIKDYNVLGEAIIETTAEISWTPSSSSSSYQAIIAREDEGSLEALPFTSTHVTCPKAPQLCLVHFVGLAHDTFGTNYEINLKPTDPDGTPLDTNIVISEPFILNENSGAQVPIIDIVQLTRVIPGQAQNNEDTALQVQVLSKNEIQNVVLVNLVIIHTHDDPTIQYSYEATESTPLLADTPTGYNFIVPSANLLMDKSMTLLVLMRDANDQNLAYSEASVTLIEFPDVKVESVGINTQDDPEVPASLRIDQCFPNISVNGRECTTSSDPEVEYFLRYEDLTNPVLVCYTNVNDDVGVLAGSVAQCDSMQQMTVYAEMTGAGAVLTRSKSPVTTTLLITNHDFDTTAGGEVVYYLSGETSSITSPEKPQTCAGNDECQVTVSQVPEGDTYSEFNIVVVDLQEDIQESLDFLFGDYQVKVEQLTVDAIEVRWRAAVNTQYHVNLPEGEGGAFDDTLVNCGAEEESNCRAYFISMVEAISLVAEVRKGEDGTRRNVVGREFELSNTASDPPNRAAVLYLEVDGGITNLKVCPRYEQQQQQQQGKDSFILHPPSYVMAVVDLQGNQLTQSEYDVEYGNTCFAAVNLASLGTNEVRLLVHTDTLFTNISWSPSPLVTLSAFVYLLDPNSESSEHLRVKQVGSDTLRVLWSNKDSHSHQYNFTYSSEDSVQPDTMILACGGGEDCGTFLHLYSPSSSTPVYLTITEDDNQGLVQHTTLTVPRVEVEEELNILSYDILWDDRLKVCFEEPSLNEAVRYELGLQKGSVYLETTTNPEITVQDDGSICVVSTHEMDVSAYVDLWILVTALNDNDGSLLASGEDTWTDIWSGSYTVCVTANKFTISSEEVCSDIITVSSKTDLNIPEVGPVAPKSTSETALLVTWDPPTDLEVTSFLVSWNNTTPAADWSRFRRLHPASLARKHFRAQTTDLGFTIVPATSTSVEITDLEANVTYDICVVSVKSDVVGDMNTDSCSTTTTGNYDPIPSPTDLKVVGDKLSWHDYTTNNDSHTYLVEWTSSQDKRGGHEDLTVTEWAMSVLDPGEWELSVRVSDGESVSPPTALEVTISGVEINPTQDGYKTLHVSWVEVGQVSPVVKRYDVSIRRGVSQPVIESGLYYCTGMNDDCTAIFEDINVEYPDSGDGVKLLVRVEKIITNNNNKINNNNYNSNNNIKDNYDEQQFVIYPLNKVSGLSKNIKKSNEVVVSWQEVEGAKRYILNLYTNSSHLVLRASYEQTLPTMYNLTEKDMMGNSLTIQACKDDNHCSETTSISITNTPSDNTPAIVLSVLAGVLVLAFITFCTVYAIKSNQAKKKLKDELKKQKQEEQRQKEKEQRQREEDQRQRELTERQNQLVYDQWGSRPLGRKGPSPQPPHGHSTPSQMSTEGQRPSPQAQAYPMVPLN